MLLAEELLLLGLDPEKGTVVNSARQYVKVGLSGALVAELALDGQVELRDRRFVPSGKEQPADPLLRDVRAALASPKGRRSKDQVRRLDKAAGGVWDRVAARLVDRGVVELQPRSLFRTERYPVLDLAARAELLERVRAAAATDGQLDPRTAVVLALSGPCRLLEVVAPDRASRKQARQRIDAATALTPVAPVVKAVIADVQVAVTAAVAAAGAAAAASG
ncbi:GOLPH3/VPS74 family protein [Motilibacter aurantiacus]|uniref:GOLPH3/VPS74 family protein n=1 Tax=Motilibacter aurantiacus TaxID=2714955 RepID=UPI001407C7DD|nr:GPP34 family phosphoprotein [Motilibacter aurantiacus]NHC43744.1 GPP34 family phosphoprotein [Motilibacter aurantiacus]